MTPKEFADKMREIFPESCDTEGAHGEADALICELLKKLGYEEGVLIYEAAEKWYA